MLAGMKVIARCLRVVRNPKISGTRVTSLARPLLAMMFLLILFGLFGVPSLTPSRANTRIDDGSLLHGLGTHHKVCRQVLHLAIVVVAIVRPVLRVQFGRRTAKAAGVAGQSLLTFQFLTALPTKWDRPAGQTERPTNRIVYQRLVRRMSV